MPDYHAHMELEHNPYQPPAVAVPYLATGEAELPSRMARLGAAMIDALAVGIVAFPLQYAYGVYDNFPAVKMSTGSQLLWNLVGALLFLAIQGRLLATRAQTVGKMLLGLRIVTLGGEQADFQRIALKRVLPLLAAQAVPYVGGILSLIDVLFIFRADRRCVHDLIAETKVVKA